MKKVWKVLSYVLVAALASLVTLAAGAKTSVQADGTAVTAGTQTQSKLEQLEDLIEDRFIGESDRTAMEDAAAEAMIASLGDRWSYYVSAEAYQSYIDSVNNSYVGIGVTIQLSEEGDSFEIIKVNEGGPADEAGLLAGDWMTAVDGTSILGMNSNEVGNLVKGQEGTYVDITVRRGGEELTLSVERRQVIVEVAAGQLLEGNVGLVTIANFHKGCASETIGVIEDLLGQGAEALILDVRNNGGGYATELVDLLDYLLPEGVLFRTVNYAGEEEIDYSDADCLEIPMAVMVNGNSYSAAEFFAVALSEYEAAVVVGEQTVGKGYYQVNYQLSDGSAVSLSIGEYFTPNGENLAGVGITPDIEVIVDEETAAAIYAGALVPMEDPQILAAWEALREE